MLNLWHFYTACFNHIPHPFPTLLQSTILSSLAYFGTFFSQGQFVLPKYYWLCGHPLECAQITEATFRAVNLKTSTGRYMVSCSPPISVPGVLSGSVCLIYDNVRNIKTSMTVKGPINKILYKIFLRASLTSYSQCINY